MEDSTIQQPLTISNQFSFQPVTFSNPSASLNTGFRTEFPTQFTAVTSNYNFEPPGPRNINFGGPIQAVPQVSFNTGAGSSQFSSFTPYPQIKNSLAKACGNNKKEVAATLRDSDSGES